MHISYEETECDAQKKYIDTADAKVVKIIHAMLEVDADNNWWDTMPQG